MQKQLIAVVLALAAGLFIGIAIQPASDTGPVQLAGPQTSNMSETTADETNVNANPIVAELEVIKRQLQQEVMARRQLEKRFEDMQRQMPTVSSESRATEEIDDAVTVSNDSAANDRSPNRAWFDEQALIDSGMDSFQAGELRLFFEQLEMERLHLRDRAAREAWGNDRLRESMRTLDSREEDLETLLDEAAYDAYLYASGQTNRVDVGNVLENAPAGIAGILPGDHIIRYDNQRIYNILDLRRAITGGEVNDTVEVEIEREGRTVQHYLMRGPLGIRTNSLSIAP